jgi:hypothetical protein
VIGVPEIVAGVIGAFIGGWASAAISRRLLERERARVREIVLAEYSYWANSVDTTDAETAIKIGATGALANVLSAIEIGQRKVRSRA